MASGGAGASKKSASNDTKLLYPKHVPKQVGIDKILADVYGAMSSLSKQGGMEQSIMQNALQQQQEMYPYMSQLNEALSKQALEGINADMPSWMKNQYRNEVASVMGDQFASPIGADTYSTGLLSFQEQYRDKFRKMGQEQAALLPPVQPISMNMLAGMTPQNILPFYSNSYNTYAQAQRPMTGAYGHSNASEWHADGSILGG